MHVAILGGGISGLTTAWELEKALGDQVQISLIEKSSRLGGWIQTDQIGDFLFERGPHSFIVRAGQRAAIQLIKELGLKDDILVSASSAKNRFVWHQGKLEQVPMSFFQAACSPLTRDLFWTFLKEWRVSASNLDDESIYHFICRRYSPEVAERLIDPLVACIYGGDMRSLSVKTCFSWMKQWEQEQGSLLKKGIKQIFRKKPISEFSGPITLKQGMEALPRALANQLKHTQILQAEVLGLVSNSEEIQIKLREGSYLTADYVVSALPAFALNQLLADLKLNLSYTSLVVVNVGWNGDVLPLEGFGCVFPQRTQSSLLGIIFDSSAFPGQNRHPSQTRLTLMLGRNPDLCQQSDEYLGHLSLGFLKEHLNIHIPPDQLGIFRAKNAIPQYSIGYEQVVTLFRKQLQQKYPYLFLAGSLCGEVGITGCINQANQVVKEIAEFAKKRSSIYIQK